MNKQVAAQNARTYMEKGNRLKDEGKLEDAIICHRQAIAINPKLFKSCYELGNLLQQQQKWQEAITFYHQAIEINPNLANPYLQLGLTCLQQGIRQDATHYFQETIRLNPDLFRPYLELGNIYQQEGKYPEAIDYFRAAIKLKPDLFRAYYQLTKLLTKQGRIEEAINYYRQAIAVKPDLFRAYHELGNIYLKQGNLDEAIICYLQAITINPGLEPVYYHFWWLDVNEQLRQKVISACQQALELTTATSSMPLIKTTLGNLFTQQNQLDQAINYYQSAIHTQTHLYHPKLVDNYWDINQNREPDFFVIGGMKCGSTALYKYLCQHPQVLPPLLKEIHFFDEHYEQGINWYLAHFPSIASGQTFLSGEATPCLGAPNVWQKIAHSFPQIKLLVLLRNPVDRAYSHYHHIARRYGVNHEFEEAILADLTNQQLRQRMLEDANAYKEVKSSYISLGLYVYWLQEWLKFFPPQQLLILNSDDLNSQTAQTMQQVYDFLGLPHHELPHYAKENSGSYLPISDSLHQQITEYYQPHNQKLEAFLGRKFAW